ncbi:GM25201 [Drosophila sechellia]|uniref:GM25201 n=1 Tax=Drosophila sechellia TaxID=7238 RepID=B4HLS8_DROSE|nr:GM25201 [Drosophila sechellia]
MRQVVRREDGNPGQEPLDFRLPGHFRQPLSALLNMPVARTFVYECVLVRESRGEHPEAMQTGSSGCQYNWLTIVLLLGLVLCYSSQQCSSAVPASLTSTLPSPSQLPLPAAAAATTTATGESASSESVTAARASAATTTTTATRKRCPAVKSCRQTAGRVLTKRPFRDKGRLGREGVVMADVVGHKLAATATA